MPNWQTPSESGHNYRVPMRKMPDSDLMQNMVARTVDTAPTANSNGHQINSSFRVENRRARPMIIKNSVDRGTMFFSQQANSISSSQHNRRRREIASQGNKHAGSSMAKPVDFPAPSFEAPANSNTDQYNFTFFKERAEHATPQP